MIGLNNNIVTLSERDVDEVSCVRLDWDKVGGWIEKSVSASKIEYSIKTHTDNGHLVAINSNSPSRLRSGIDKAEEVLLARLNFPGGVCTGREIGLRVVAVEQIVGCTQWTIVDDVVVFLNCSNVETVFVSWGYFWRNKLLTGRRP